MTFEIQNMKVLSNQANYPKPDYEREWADYAEEFPERLQGWRNSPEDRYAEGIPSDECFAQAIEYCHRSLIHRNWQRFIADKLTGLLKSQSKSTVLDYGCGAGNVGLYFVEAGLEVDFADIEGQITDFVKWRLKRRGLKNEVKTQHSTLGSYDLALMINVIEHLSDPMGTFTKVLDSIKPGGYLFYTFNSHDHGLDIVSIPYFNVNLLPILHRDFEVVPKTDGMLWKKKQ